MASGMTVLPSASARRGTSHAPGRCGASGPAWVFCRREIPSGHGRSRRRCTRQVAGTRWQTFAAFLPANSFAIAAMSWPRTAISTCQPVSLAMACAAAMVSKETRFSFDCCCSATTRMVSGIGLNFEGEGIFAIPCNAGFVLSHPSFARDGAPMTLHSLLKMLQQLIWIEEPAVREPASSRIRGCLCAEWYRW